MYDFFWNFGSFIVALGILITAHEFGHFWVARRCGVKVERFSIGFGKAIWRKVGKDGTEYVIALIPLGGYVKMLDERVDDVPEALKSQAFNRKSVWQRIAIVAAGPIANFIFAVFALYLMYLIGVPAVKPVLDEVKAGSPAAVVSLNAQPEEIIAISGQKVRNWEEVNYALMGHIGDDDMVLTLAPVDRLQDDANGRNITIDLRQWQFDPEKQLPSTSLGLIPFRPDITSVIAQVSPESAASAAGIKAGDEIIAFDGSPYTDWQSLSEHIRASADKTLQVTVMRDGQSLTLTVTPRSITDASGQQIGVLGIVPTAENWPENMLLQLQYGIVGAVGAALDKTWQLMEVSVKMFAKLITGDVSVKNLSGPISIAQGAGNSADVGLVYFLGFLALISVNLGIVNLLPLPVLDGGHLMYYFVEVVTGKPVPEKIQEIGFRIGAALLLLLMSVAIFNDFARL